LKKKATKLDVLLFIKQKEIISAFDLVERFGYTSDGAGSMLSWLKREKLVINGRRGEWELTDAGLSKLIYYGRI